MPGDGVEVTEGVSVLHPAHPDVVDTLRPGARRGLVVVRVYWRGGPHTAPAASPPQPPGQEGGVAGEAGAGAHRPQLLLAGSGVTEPLVCHNLPHDDVAVKLDSEPGGLHGLYLVSVLVLRIHCHELEQHQVQQSSNDGQTEHDEEEREDDVLWSLLECVVLLESNQISKAWTHLSPLLG